MKAFRVEAIETVHLYIDVLAENEEDALEKAEEADGSWFTETSSSWECGNATEINSLGTVINSKYENGGSISLMETNHDYDFIAMIDNSTDETLKIFVDDLEGWYAEPIVVNPHDWVGFLADEEGRNMVAMIKAGDFKAVYV